MALLTPPQRTRFPGFAGWLDGKFQSITQGNHVWPAFLKHSELSPDAATQAIAPDQIPIVFVMPMAGEGQHNRLVRPNAIDIAHRLVVAYEAASSDDAERIVESTLLHELVHWAWRDRLEPREMGDLFEQEAYSAFRTHALTAETPTAEIDEQLPLGGLSRRWEAHGDPGAVGNDRTGGPSYGLYQIASHRGRILDFLRFLRNRPDFARFATPLEAAGGDRAARRQLQRFVRTWKQLALKPQFSIAQHDYIESTHYGPFSRQLAGTIDLSSRSHALREVAWSVSVQHGPAGTHIFTKPWGVLTESDQQSDRILIGAIYDYRSRVDLHFRNSSAAVKASVQRRFVEERTAALALLPA